MAYIDKESREKRAGIVTNARALISKQDVTQEDHQQFDAMMAEADALQALAQKREQIAAVEAEMNETIFQSAERFGRSPDQERDMQATSRARFFAHLKSELGAHMTSHERQNAADYRAALGVGTATAGGNTVEPSLQRKMYAALKEIGPVRKVAQVITTSQGNPMNFPLVDDTANGGALVAENTSHGTATDPSVTQATMGAYKFTSGVQPVSIELLQDSVFDVEQWINDLFTQRLSRTTNGYYTTGTGSSQPQGVITASPVGVTTTTGQTTTLLLDNIIDLVHAVDPAYRQSGSCAFMMNDSIIKAVRKLKDSTGQMLWQESMQLGQPSSLFGYPVVLNQSMASTLAVNAKVMAFGDFSNYLIRDTLQMTFVIFKEKYRDSGQIGFLIDLRSDGRLISGGAPIKVLQMAAS